MKLREVMTSSPTTCSAADSLATAATLMWENDCGVVPVVEGGRPVGMVTDRDVCMATAFQNAPASELTVGEAMSTKVHSCSQSDSVDKALQLMRDRRVRRLPILDRGRNLVGIVSLNDLLQASKARPAKSDGPAYKDIVQTMKKIGEHRHLPSSA